MRLVDALDEGRKDHFAQYAVDVAAIVGQRQQQRLVVQEFLVLPVDPAKDPPRLLAIGEIVDDAQRAFVLGVADQAAGDVPANAFDDFGADQAIAEIAPLGFGLKDDHVTEMSHQFVRLELVAPWQQGAAELRAPELEQLQRSGIDELEIEIEPEPKRN